MSATPMIHGLSLLGYGYDVFASPYCVDEERRGTKAGEPLVRGLTKTDASYAVSVLGREYLCPQIVQFLGEQRSGKSQTVYGSTVQDYFRQLAGSAHFGASVGAFTGSIDASFSVSTKKYTEYIYGEYSYTEKGFKIELGEPAALRSLIPEKVREILRGDPAKAIAQFGTHLVGGVVIGGKATLRQYSLREDVKDESEWQAALEASYGKVTVGAKVDSKYSSCIATFKMQSIAKTLGGDGMPIGDKDAFGAWSKTIANTPAVVDFVPGRLVPLWQLLDPNEDTEARRALREAIVNHARRFQAGALYGGFQDYTSEDGSQPSQRGNEWGAPNDGALEQLAWVNAWSQAYEWGASSVNVRLSTGEEEGRSLPDLNPVVVYGGRQQASDRPMSKPLVEISSWGVRRHPLTNQALQEQPIATGLSWSSQYGWGNSVITLFVGPLATQAQGGSVIVGGQQLASDGDSARPWKSVYSWGEGVGGGIHSQYIGMLRGWSQDYGPGASKIELHLRPVLSDRDLPEVTEAGQQATKGPAVVSSTV